VRHSVTLLNCGAFLLSFGSDFQHEFVKTALVKIWNKYCQFFSTSLLYLFHTLLLQSMAAVCPRSVEKFDVLGRSAWRWCMKLILDDLGMVVEVLGSGWDRWFRRAAVTAHRWLSVVVFDVFQQCGPASWFRRRGAGSAPRHGRDRQWVMAGVVAEPVVGQTDRRHGHRWVSVTRFVVHCETVNRQRTSAVVSGDIHVAGATSLCVAATSYNRKQEPRPILYTGWSKK